MGFTDETKGTLFFQITRILEASKPKFIILENVKNLLSRDHGNTICVISGALTELGYNIKIIVMSPHQLGIPQLRERVYILGVRKDLYDGELVIDAPQREKSSVNIYDANTIEENAPEKYNIGT